MLGWLGLASAGYARSGGAEVIGVTPVNTMRFMIGDVEVFFPYAYIYKEQYEYMLELKACPRLVCCVAATLAEPVATSVQH